MEKPRTTPRREESLSRDRIIEAAIELLDNNGEDGLTFRTLAERLATGPGALYWHVANKNDLLIAACDAIVAHTVQASVNSASPQANIRALALGMFDALDEHPWVGSVLIRAAGQLPIVRMFERIGQQVCALGVPATAQWATACTLLNYILGEGAQNAANGQLARARGLDRTHYLDALAAAWAALDPAGYPFTRSAAGLLCDHDDRADFLAGIDLILGGIKELTAAI